jgi:uncharacterized protein
MPELAMVDWAVLVAAAVLIGVAKTAINGVASLSIAMFALVVPARESTAAVLALLLVGDVIAIAVYRQHADWAKLVRLLPSVLPGLALGAWFVVLADQELMKRGIGVILLVLAALQLRARRSERTRVGERAAGEPVGDLAGPAGPAGPAAVAADRPGRPPGRWAAARGKAAAPAAGLAAGFATMTANAAGPVMTLYLLLAGLSILQLLGTGAWFFFLVNLAKIPFSAGLDLFDGPMLLVDLLLVPAVLLGAAAGAAFAPRISRRRFEDATIVLTTVAAGALLI